MVKFILKGDPVSMLLQPTKAFLKELKKESEKFEKDKEKGKNFFNIFDALDLCYKEVYHSAFIAYLLNPRSEHYQSEFLKEFLSRLKDENIPEIIFKEALNVEKLEDIKTEKNTDNIKQNRRIDILLKFKDNVNIILENKIYAKDQAAQIKDYVENIRKENKKLSEQESAKKTLVIYLHPKNELPSEFSLGKTSSRIKKFWKLSEEGKYQVIKDENENLKAYFLSMDYKWIKKWLEVCLKNLQKRALSKPSGESKTRGELGLDKIIFGVGQYLEILEWYINDEYEEDNALLEFILANNKNTQMALSVFEDKKQDLHTEVKKIWGEVSKALVNKFYQNLEQVFEKGKKIGKEKYYGNRDENSFRIYAAKDKDKNFYPNFHFYYQPTNFKQAKLDLNIMCWYWDEKEKEKYENLIKECEQFFKEKAGHHLKKYHASYSSSFIFGKDFNEELENKKYSFSKWLIEQGDGAVDEFIRILGHFMSLEPVNKTLQVVEKFIEDKKIN